MTARDDLEAAIRRQLTNAMANGADRLSGPPMTAFLNAATTAILNAHHEAAGELAAAAVAEAARLVTVHYLNIAGNPGTLRIACGLAGISVVNSTDRSRVTCAACKRTDAWRAAA